VLNDQQRQTLLSLARESIRSIHQGRVPELNPEDFDETLRRPAGAFVTLHTNDGDLRGCIGSIRAVEPLFRAVSSSAISAAFRDPRFDPVHPEELERLHLEVSVMGPIERISGPADIEVGRDGLIISNGRHAGLLLPQVATEQGWDAETFLDHTCRKAGLPPGSWRHESTRIERFSAEVFSEPTDSN
jgi:AmmeMemoRadiSam system protein A